MTNTMLDPLWPASARQLAAEIGAEAVRQLCYVYGGTYLYVPCRISDDSALNMELGTRAAARLAQVYGGQRLEVPLLNRSRTSERHRAIVADRQAGISMRELALRHQMSIRHVRSILARARGGNQSA